MTLLNPLTIMRMLPCDALTLVAGMSLSHEAAPALATTNRAGLASAVGGRDLTDTDVAEPARRTPGTTKTRT